jgi:hypothetical protein
VKANFVVCNIFALQSLPFPTSVLFSLWGKGGGGGGGGAIILEVFAPPHPTRQSSQIIPDF